MFWPHYKRIFDFNFKPHRGFFNIKFANVWSLDGVDFDTYNRRARLAIVRNRECTNVPGLDIAKPGSILPFCMT